MTKSNDNINADQICCPHPPCKSDDNIHADQICCPHPPCK